MKHQRILTLQKLIQQHRGLFQDTSRLATATAATPSSHFSTAAATTPTTQKNGSQQTWSYRIPSKHYSTWRKSQLFQNLSSIVSPNQIPIRHYPTVKLKGGHRNVVLPDSTLRSPLSDIKLSEKSFHQFIFEKCEKFGDKPALSDVATGKTYTYSQVKEKANRLASALSRRGYKKGDIILVFSRNQIDYPILFLACSAIGAWFCPANPDFTPGELARQISVGDAVAVFAHESLVGVCNEAMDMGAGYPHDIRPNGKFVFGDASGYESFETLLQDDGSALPNVKIEAARDVLAMPWSSGTTGLPKGVMLSHQNITTNVMQILASFHYNKGENVLGLLPLYHIYGLVAVQAGSLASGAHLHIVPKFEPESFLKCMQDRKIETANLVPPLLLFLAKNDKVADYDLSHLKNVIVGAAPLGKELSEEFQDRFENVDLLQGFGMTETSPVTHIDMDCIHGSVGSLVANTKAKVVDLKKGKELGPSEEGELCISGPQVMLGYYKNWSATRGMVSEDGWLHTGDIAYYDERGICFISDRMKELIKYKGNQVAPAELEALILGHPEVADVCIVGKPDELAGEVPMAYVVKKPGAHITGEDVVSYLDGHVADTKKLRGGVEFVDEIPRNPSGKILRRLLQESQD